MQTKQIANFLNRHEKDIHNRIDEIKKGEAYLDNTSELGDIDPQELIQAATNLIETGHPYSFDALLHRSMAYFRLNEYKLSIDDMLKRREIMLAKEQRNSNSQEKHKMQSDISASTNHIAFCYLMLNNTPPHSQYAEKTLYWIEESIKLAPVNPSNYFNLSVYYQQIDQYEKAKECLLKARALVLEYDKAGVDKDINQEFISTIDETLSDLENSIQKK
jgi:tetratricopeptide (TPR) repeat protein